MMGPAAGFLLAIMGCGESSAQCDQVALSPVRYASEADCLADSDRLIARHSDADYPTIVAQCRAATARIAGLRGDQVSRPEGGPVPTRLRTASLRR